MLLKLGFLTENCMKRSLFLLFYTWKWIRASCDFYKQFKLYWLVRKSSIHQRFFSTCFLQLWFFGLVLDFRILIFRCIEELKLNTPHTFKKTNSFPFPLSRIHSCWHNLNEYYGNLRASSSSASSLIAIHSAR